LTFFAAARFRLSARVFLVTDAVGLALFTVVGTQIALGLQVHWLPASFLGVFSGVMGGILRDILCNEEPLVFRGPLYATAAWAGALLYVLLMQVQAPGITAPALAGLMILSLRWASLRWSWQLPFFEGRPANE
ncbi:MAG: trimeric intracellular cation channel family protein, partial [Oceanococcaceae bacterium]